MVEIKMATIDELAQKSNVSPNTIVRVLCKENFKDLKKHFIHARYELGLDISTLAYVRSGNVTCFNYPLVAIDLITINPILKDAPTSALIGAIAHELGHALFYATTNPEDLSRCTPNQNELATDAIASAHGLYKYLIEFTRFIETLPPEDYGYPKGHKMTKKGGIL